MTKQIQHRHHTANLLAALGGLCIILGLTLFEDRNGQLIILSLGVILPMLSIFYGPSNEGCEDNDTP